MGLKIRANLKAKGAADGRVDQISIAQVSKRLAAASDMEPRILKVSKSAYLTTSDTNCQRPRRM